MPTTDKNDPTARRRGALCIWCNLLYLYIQIALPNTQNIYGVMYLTCVPKMNMETYGLPTINLYNCRNKQKTIFCMRMTKPNHCIWNYETWIYTMNCATPWRALHFDRFHAKASYVIHFHERKNAFASRMEDRLAERILHKPSKFDVLDIVSLKKMCNIQVVLQVIQIKFYATNCSTSQNSGIFLSMA